MIIRQATSYTYWWWRVLTRVLPKPIYFIVYRIWSCFRLLACTYVFSGWLRSLISLKSVDMYGNPIPWFSYPAVAYLDGEPIEGKSVLEWGGGQSTLYWLKRGAASVTAIEFRKDWADYIVARANAPDRLTVIVAPMDESYSNAVTGQFDIVVVDGELRKECTHRALHMVKPNGMLIFDNTDDFPDCAQIIRDAGYREFLFWGSAALLSKWQVTSVFIKR
jgi:hypothetical protein